MKNRLEAFNFKGKRVLVMGLGLHGGGVETVKFLLKEGARVTVTDLRDSSSLLSSLTSLKKYKRRIRYILGRHRASDVLNADILVKNPGIPPTSQYLLLAERAKIPITSDMGIFFSRCPAKIIGVTGTRGKSTTAYLIWKILKTKYKRVFLGGNIRTSVLTFLPKIKASDLVVIELSSFQLQDLARESIHKKSPDIAVITNVLRDHLNWHRSLHEYIKAKSFIFRFQKQNDFLFINPRDRLLKKNAREALSHVISARLPSDFYKLVDEKLGAHYRSSVALVYEVVRHFGIKRSKILSELKTFKGLEGRQEYLGKIHGINFVNDTTATIPDATIAALIRFRHHAKSNLILIAGGQDKKLNFNQLSYAIKRYVDYIILLPGTATQKIMISLRKTNYPRANIYTAKSMHNAVLYTQRLAGENDWVILSPGAASFGLFSNEFDRGAQFVSEINKFKSLKILKT